MGIIAASVSWGLGLFVGPALRIHPWKNRRDGEIRKQNENWQ